MIAFGDVDERDIRDINPEELRGYTQCHFFAGIGVWSYALRLAGWPDDRPVWTGSPPCQPFSAAGRGAGVADERHLWPHWHHLIRECRPVQVFGEQVASKDGLGWLDLVQSDMEGSDYAGGAVDLCAAGVGAPHIRQRQFFFTSLGASDPEGHRWGEERPVYQRFGSGDREKGRPAGFGAIGSLERLGDSSSPRLQGLPWDGPDPRGRALADRSASEAGAVGALGHDGRGRCDAGIAGNAGSEAGSGGEHGLVADRSCRADQLADIEISGRQGWTGLCDQRTPEQRRAILADGGGLGALANTQGSRWGVLDSENQRSPDASGDTSANADNSTFDRAFGFAGFSERPCPTNGFWRVADWLFCRDGKWRAVESGSFPLVDGAAFRLDSGSAFAGKSRAQLLKGAGNAIVSEAAAHVIAAFLEAEADEIAALDARRGGVDLIEDLL